MKKLTIMLLLLIIVLSGCKVYMIAEGIVIYNPDKDDSPGIMVDLPEEYTIEYFVDTADVIAKVIVEDTTHAEVIMEEKDALGKRGLFGSIRYIEVYYSGTNNETEGRGSNVYIDYTPDYINVNNPNFEDEGEYIVFLKRISPDMPFVFHNFYDYFLLTDYITYKLDTTSENEKLIKDLIKEYK